MSLDQGRVSESHRSVSSPGFLKVSRSSSVVIKNALDVVGGFALLLLLLPLFLAIGIAVKLDSPGPVLYRRRVVGLGGRPFLLFKFRTMVNNAHDLLSQNPELMEQYRTTLKIANDPRVTRLGRVLRKMSLDELPQLFNTVCGDMSLVGPRVLGEIELERYGAGKERVLSVKPGITGLWQVSGRHSVSFERRMELDWEYIDNWNLWLDFKILLMTIPAVLTGKGAS